MARPKGYRISPKAWDDIVVAGKKLTVTEVAALTGINRATISGLLGGHARASLSMARTLADGIGVHVESLFPLTDRSFAADAEAA